MNYGYRCACIVLALLLSVGLAGAASASSMTVVLGAVEGANGSEVEVPIDIRDTQKLGAMQMELTYDPALLEAKTVKQGNLPQEIAIGHNVIEPGRLRIVMNTAARESISGDGTLMKAVFQVKGGKGQRCDLRLEGLRAWDNTTPESRPFEMLVTAEPGTFAVPGGLPVLVLIAAGAAAVLAALVVVAAVARKRRRKETAAVAPPN
jgi:hypothetical protein